MSSVVANHLATVDQIKFFVDYALRGDFPPEVRFFQVAPDTSHIHWLVGHVAFAIDRIGLGGLEGAPGLPEERGPLFGWATKPISDVARYPTWDQIVAELYETIGRFRAHVAGQSDADLAKPLPADHPFARAFKTRGEIISFAGDHTCYHLGQVALLRRAQGLPAGSQVKS